MRQFLPKEAAVIDFVNADLITGGLSPLDTSAGRGSCRKAGAGRTRSARPRPQELG